MGKPVTQEMIDEIMRRHKKGLSSRAIALDIGMPRSTVSVHIAKQTQPDKKAAPKKSTPQKTTPPKTLKKDAKAVTKETTIHTFAPFVIPAGAPICNATATGTYTGSELRYRQPRA